MAYNRLVGLKKGKRAFCACFLMSAAGGFVYIYTHARTRKGFGLSFLFRKLNKVGSDTLTSLENKTRSVMFRKLNKGRDEKRSTGFLGRSGSLISKAANGRGLSCLCIRTHARALAPFFLFRSFLIRKNSFIFFILSLYISFFFFFFL